MRLPAARTLGVFMLIVTSFIGGLFLGYLASVLAFFVWGLVKEGLHNPKQMAVPAIFLLGIFGTALIYLAGIVLENWALLGGAAITFAHGARKLFGPEEPIQKSR